MLLPYIWFLFDVLALAAQEAETDLVKFTLIVEFTLMSLTIHEAIVLVDASFPLFLPQAIINSLDESLKGAVAWR